MRPYSSHCHTACCSPCPEKYRSHSIQVVSPSVAKWRPTEVIYIYIYTYIHTRRPTYVVERVRRGSLFPSPSPPFHPSPRCSASTLLGYASDPFFLSSEKPPNLTAIRYSDLAPLVRRRCSETTRVSVSNFEVLQFHMILEGLRPMPLTRTLKTSGSPDRLHVTLEGPRNQQRDRCKCSNISSSSSSSRRSAAWSI